MNGPPRNGPAEILAKRFFPRASCCLPRAWSFRLQCPGHADAYSLPSLEEVFCVMTTTFTESHGLLSPVGFGTPRPRGQSVVLVAWDLPSVSHMTFHDLSQLRWASPAQAPRAGSAPGPEETQLAAAAGVRPAPTSLGSHLWPVRQTRNPGPAAAQGTSILDRTRGPPCPWLQGPRD